MIVDERIVTFINSLETENSEILEAVEQEALSTYVPIIRKEMQSFLKVLLMIQKPMCILEVGTAVGFSALLMSEAAPEGCRITTIENYEKRIPIARENFRRAGKEEQITLIEGDAMDVLKTLEGSFDFIFMDAAKGQYIRYMPQVLRLLRPGGTLVTDNVLQDGDIIESRFAVERRNRTIHSRIAPVWTLSTIFASASLSSITSPLWMIKIFSFGIPRDCAISAFAFKWRYSPCTGMAYFGFTSE